MGLENIYCNKRSIEQKRSFKKLWNEYLQCIYFLYKIVKKCKYALLTYYYYI